MLNLMIMFIFLVLNQNYPFRVNLVRKVKFVSLSWILAPRLIWMSWLRWCSVFLFWTRKTLFGEFGYNYENSFKVFFFRLFNLVIASSWFDELIKTHEYSLNLPSLFLICNAVQESMLTERFYVTSKFSQNFSHIDLKPVAFHLLLLLFFLVTSCSVLSSS